MLIHIFESALAGSRPSARSRRDRFALVRRARNESAVAYVRASVATLAEAESLAADIPPRLWESQGWDIMRQGADGRLYSLNSDSFGGLESADSEPAAASSLAALASLAREV